MSRMLCKKLRPGINPGWKGWAQWGVSVSRRCARTEAKSLASVLAPERGRVLSGVRV